MKKYVLVLILLLAVVFAVGCAESDSNDSNNQGVDNPSNVAENLSKETAVSSNQSANPDTEWIASLKTHSMIIQTDLQGLSAAQNPFDADILKKYGQNLVDDTQRAIEEDENCTVSPSLDAAKKHWGSALRDYNMAGQFTTIGADAYLNEDYDSATTNFQKAATFYNSANADVNLTFSYIN